MGETDDKPYRTTIAIVFAVTMTCVAMSLRFLARKLHKISPGADDYTMIVGAVFTIANALVYVWTNRYGNGRHVVDVDPHDFVLYWRTFYVSYQLYGVAITSIKISILLFYRRIFSTSHFRRILNVIGILVLVWLAAGNLLFAFQCSPIRKAWERETPGHCIDSLRAVQVVQAFNVALDAVILALPVSGVLHLQISTSRKISVLGVFLLGGLSVVIALIRFIILLNENQDDITYKTSLSSWTVIEPAVEVVSGCLPTMAPLLNIRIHLKDFSSIFRSSFSGRRSRSKTAVSDNSQRMYGYELHQLKLRPDQDTAMVSEASVKRSVITGTEEDLVPLHSIMVRKDMNWEETTK